MYCQLSGSVPEEPVVNVKTGHVYERRLIEKHIETVGTDPANKGPIDREDLLPLKTDRAVLPRPVTSTSIPGMLSAFQSEWDSLMLETHTLKKTLDKTRQELSQALYQHDAACRVIARLTRERDQAREALTRVSAISAPSSAPESKEDTALPSDTVERMAAKTAELSAARKKRKAPKTLASKSTVGGWKEIGAFKVHKSATPAVLSIDVNSQADNLIVSGGADGTAQVFDRKEMRVVCTLEGHTKAVNKALFHKQFEHIITASSDRTVRIWDNSGTTMSAFQVADAEVTGLALHPLGDFAVSCSSAGTWSVLDLSKATVLAKKNTASGSLLSTAVHPDGQIVATTGPSSVSIWNINNCSLVAEFTGHEGAVNAVAFSENGYTMVSGGDDGTVKIWDLRYESNPHTISVGKKVSSLAFNHSGAYLAVGSEDSVGVYAAKKWTVLSAQEAPEAAVTGVCFGKDAHYLATSSLDKNVRFFG